MSNGESTQGVFGGYDGGEEPLPSYAALVGLFNLILAAFLLIARKTGRPIPERIEARDIALLGVATHKLSVMRSRAPCAPRSPSSRRSRAQRPWTRNPGARA